MSTLPQCDKRWCAERFLLGDSVETLANDLRVSRLTVEAALREMLSFRVASVRVQARGRHVGRQHLACLVAREPPTDARVLPLRWYRRARRPRESGRRPLPVPK